MASWTLLFSLKPPGGCRKPSGGAFPQERSCDGNRGVAVEGLEIKST